MSLQPLQTGNYYAHRYFELKAFPLPIKSEYKIFTGKIPSRYDAEMLKTSNVVAAIVLVEQSTMELFRLEEFYKENELEYFHFPIEDFGTPPSTQYALSIVNTILKVVEVGNVYIHCMGGRGRTGMIMACLTAFVKQINGFEAIHYTRRIIPGAIEARTQETFVDKFFTEQVCQVIPDENNQAIAMEKYIPNLAQTSQMINAPKKIANHQDKTFQDSVKRESINSKFVDKTRNEVVKVNRNESDNIQMFGAKPAMPLRPSLTDGSDLLKKVQKTKKHVLCCPCPIL